MRLFDDLNGYERQKKILVCKHYKLIETIELKTGNIYCALIFHLPFEDFTRERLKNLSQQLKIITKLNHPAIQKFYGFSPVNFKNIPKPVILLEKTSDSFLDKFIAYERAKKPLPGWNDTTKLIIIYGIASAMFYLHSHDILHCQLRPSKISLDEHLFPNVTGFSNSKYLSQISNLSGFPKSRNKMDYIAPEVLKDLKYSKSSDVYSFSIIVYEMFNLKKPYSFIESKKEFITYVVNEKSKPIIYNSCPECYKNLLKRCWSQDPEDRPSFEQILFELKTNPDFITEKINKEEFFNYARMIDEYQASFGSSIEPNAIDDIIKKYSVTSKMSDFYLNSTFRPDSDEFKKIENYKIIELFKKTNFYTSYLVENKENNMKFIAKSYSFELSYLLRHEIINFCTEVNIIAQLNHPTILKFINPTHFLIVLKT